MDDIVSYVMGKKAGGGPAPTPTYQDKEITITQNGEQTITADSGYDALSSVEITTNVPQPSGKITITENGTDIDVSSYATADVNVSGGGLWKAPDGTRLSGSTFTTFDLFDTSEMTTMQMMFTGCRNLQTIPLLDTSNVTNMDSIFYNCTSLVSIPLIDTSSVKNFGYMFWQCPSLTTVPLLDTSSATSFNSMFRQGSTILTDQSLDNILRMCINATSYNGTKSLSVFQLNGYSQARIEALPSYADFVTAGWSIS